jgi:hypothetical protein
VAVNRPKVRLQIDALALHGVSPQHSDAIALAVREHLSELMHSEGVPSVLKQGGQIAALEDATLTATADSDSTSMGEDIARAIYRSLQR